MITDQAALAEVQKSWEGVKLLWSQVQRGLLSSFAQGGTSAMMVADIAHNLPLLHAVGSQNLGTP